MPSFFQSLTLRHGYLLGFLSCTSLLAAAYYFEYVMFLDPCPLCMVQRLATLLTGLGFLAAFIAAPARNRHWLTAALLFTLAAALFGWWAADHHVWLQGLPAEEVPACGPSFDYLLETLPLSELLGLMLQGNGNCAEISWMFLGLSMPEWLRLWFIGFTAAIVWALTRTLQQRNVSLP